jgi:hypothetical protein
LCSTFSRGADEPHWAFRPIARPKVPASQHRDWAHNAIDRFIAARLQREGLTPSPEADRATLIRRLSLDLTGLPPTPDEVDAFLGDTRPDAYERRVDRLLASPHYGERWARAWLDLCHYGDSDGHLTDQLRPVAWRYRDWVMRALNANMPFDEFTVSQLAGDLVVGRTSNPSDDDPVLGTGFLRQTLSNREGGADLEEYRVEQVVDRTSLVGSIWLGLTVGCARCHDHKYDLLTQEEFYRLYAFFDQADEVNIDAPLPEEREAWLRARPQYERRRGEITAPFRSAIEKLQKQWEKKLLHAAAHPGENHVWDRQWEVLGLIWGGNLGEGQLEGTEIVKLPWERRTPRQQDDLLDYFLQHGATALKDVVDEKKFREAKLPELQSQLAALKKEHLAAQATRAPVMQAALTPRQAYVHERGDFRGRGNNVSPGTPGWLPPCNERDRSGQRSPASSKKPGFSRSDLSRLDLARWLVSRHNPLTARVTVNRMWQDFFGHGIVATPDDFGARGEQPSHPELLDWLAAEFMGPSPQSLSPEGRGAGVRGWNVKHVHRLIVTSATYRQSSRPRADAAKVDPPNVLLARQASLRVPAETVRDAALAVSGLLSRKVSGPSVYPPQHERVVMEAFGHNAWKVSEGADRYRRGLYAMVLRTSPYAQAILFDAPSPQRACARRDRSNTPLQALTLLNDAAFFEMAAALGERMVREGGSSDEDRLRYGMRLCVARSPSDVEVRRLTDYLRSERAALRDATRAPDVAVAEQAAWTNVASVLLNLHEFITRD